VEHTQPHNHCATESQNSATQTEFRHGSTVRNGVGQRLLCQTWTCGALVW